MKASAVTSLCVFSSTQFSREQPLVWSGFEDMKRGYAGFTSEILKLALVAVDRENKNRRVNALPDWGSRTQSPL